VKLLSGYNLIVQIEKQKLTEEIHFHFYTVFQVRKTETFSN